MKKTILCCALVLSILLALGVLYITGNMPDQIYSMISQYFGSNEQTEEQTSNAVDLAVALESKMSELAPGFVNPTVIVGSGSSVVASGSFQTVYRASNRAGYALISFNTFIVFVNSTGGCVVYDAEWNDVTESQISLAEEAKAFVTNDQKSFYPTINLLESKITELFPDSSSIASIMLPTFNTVVSAASFKSNGKIYYGFYSRSKGFDQMDVYVIIDANGAIAKVDAEQFIFEEEYFGSFAGINTNEYKSGFEGLTSETWNGDVAAIATATMTSNAMKQSVEDAFESFATVKK